MTGPAAQQMSRSARAGGADHAVYRYRAARADGVLEAGVVEAPSHEAASALLTGRGLFPVEVALEAAPTERRRALSATDLALGLRVLATLLEAGLPIARALAALDDVAPPSWRAALPAIRASVREGQSLAAALNAAPLAIPPVVIGIVQAGEAGSGLGLAVARAAELMESTAATRAAVRNALAYPVILACAGTASVALLVGIVLPRFGAILADLGQQLPPTTRFVLGISTMVRTGGLPALLILAALVVVWHRWVTSDAGARVWHELLLTVPIVGAARRQAATARACAALAALLESGVPIAPALVHAARATGDAALKERLLTAREAIVAGEGIARALEAHEAVTVTAVRLVRAGDASGRLALMLAHAATLERRRAEQTVKSAVRLLEPGLILVFGSVVALVAAALLQAIYSVRPTP